MQKIKIFCIFVCVLFILSEVYGIKFYKAFTEISTDINNIKRIGDYRAIFRVANSEIVIYVINNDSRESVYKK